MKSPALGKISFAYKTNVLVPETRREEPSNDLSQMLILILHVLFRVVLLNELGE
jgi:hypothetical protein